MQCTVLSELAWLLRSVSGPQVSQTLSTATAGEVLGLAAPVLVHLVLGDTFRESMSVSRMAMGVGADLILGWDWISSHDLHHLFAAVSGPDQRCCSWISSRRLPAWRRARCR